MQAMNRSRPHNPIVTPAGAGGGLAAATGADATALASLIERLRAGDVRALARAISLVENGAEAAMELLSACYGAVGEAAVETALRIGFTGSPGAGMGPKRAGWRIRPSTFSTATSVCMTPWAR